MSKLILTVDDSASMRMLIEAVRAQHDFRGTPILVLSTEFSDEKKARARSAGATGWITKPFEATKLGAAIRRVCP